jgi:hypothetical protein
MPIQRTPVQLDTYLTPRRETPAEIVNTILQDFFRDLKDRRGDSVGVCKSQTSQLTFDQCPDHLNRGKIWALSMLIQNDKIRTNHIRTGCMSWGVLLLPPKSSTAMLSN